MKKRILSIAAVFTLAASFITSGLSQTAYAATPYNASNVLGQPNFTTSTPTSTQTGQNLPDGVAIDNAHNRLFVGDYSNNRVLVYGSTSFSNGQAASYVLGQPDFTTTTAAATQNKMSLPGHLYYDAGSDRLFVTDGGNNRVLIYDTTTITNGMNATNVLGQTNFTNNAAAVTQSGLNAPTGVDYDSVNKRLFVGDTNANRILIYDITTITNGMNAVNVLGQVNFITAVDTTTQSTSRRPIGVAYDGTHNRLFVAAFNSNRVTVYDTSSITNGMNAVNVLGQPDFTTATAAATQNKMTAAIGVAYDVETNRLFVSEFYAGRVTVYNVTTITNGMNATSVLGQPSFTTNACGLTAQGMCGPNGIAYDTVNNRLFETDLYQSRTLIFNFAQLVSSLPSGQAGQAYQPTTLGVNTQGTTTYTLTSGALPPGLNLNTSTGQLSGTPTDPGSYTFSISVSDDNGVAGIYTDTASYTVSIAAAAALPGLPKTGNLPGGLTAIPALLVLSGGAVTAGSLWTIRRRFNQR